MRVWPTMLVIAFLALGLGFVGGCGRAEEAEDTATDAIEQATEGAESMMEETVAVDPDSCPFQVWLPCLSRHDLV